MQDMNKVNQMFDKMFLGASSGALNFDGVSMGATDLSGASMHPIDLSGITVGSGGFHTPSEEYKPQAIN